MIAEADCGLAGDYDYLEMEGASRALDAAFREYRSRLLSGIGMDYVHATADWDGSNGRRRCSPYGSSPNTTTARYCRELCSPPSPGPAG
jgi:hypothetical protein